MYTINPGLTTYLSLYMFEKVYFLHIFIISFLGTSASAHASVQTEVEWKPLSSIRKSTKSSSPQGNLYILHSTKTKVVPTTIFNFIFKYQAPCGKNLLP